jgi:glycine/D-amino acid oxidase-like deaminating enzyme
MEHSESIEASKAMYDKAGLVFEKVKPQEAAKRWPQVNTADLNHVMYDASAGVLFAKRACKEVKDIFVEEGGRFLQQQVKSYAIHSNRCTEIVLFDGTKLAADEFVFALGPWMIRLFPELSKKIRVTRQEVFYFSSPPGQSALMENELPSWFNMDEKEVINLYGIPGNEYRGFKAAGEFTDVINDKFDTYNRFYKPEELKFVQDIMVNRFPKMKGRPLVHQEICQYTETPDSDFILDKHPDAANLWVMGGGSGHGFKMGPSMGELASDIIAKQKSIEPAFALHRLLSK